jgi:hypothetical protein
LREFVDKEESASKDTNDSYNNINDKMLLVEEVGSPKYIHRRDHWRQ